MKKTLKKVIAVAGAVAMLGCSLALTACGNKKAITVDQEAHDALNEELYNKNLGEFLAAYNKVDDAKSLGERYALQAVAEAKLLESGMFLPFGSNGGNYAISRGVPHTVTNVLWGNDSYRQHTTMVVDGAPLKSEDRSAIIKIWNEVKDAKTGAADYFAKVRAYLAEKGYTLKNSYNQAYTSDPTTWDVLATSQQSDSEPVLNTYDGLLEYDVMGDLQPALAEEIPEEVAAEDGTVTYTFKIRKGLKWTNSEGSDVADVKASDFVTGFQHMLDAQGGLEYLVDGLVVGAHEYMEDANKDFSKVGVTADDEANTVTYKLTGSTSYFTTMLGYGVFAPLSKDFYTSKGGKFGKEYNPEAEDYLYGKDQNSIAYCGPYLIKEFTPASTIKYIKNEKWWNNNGENARNVDTITWLYNDGEIDTKSYDDMKAGTTDGSGLNAARLEKAKSDKVEGTDKSYFDLYSYVTSTDATTFSFLYNINRGMYANETDANVVKSPQSKKEAARTQAAMQNHNFRMALASATNRENYQAQTLGAEVAKNSIRNTYTPGNFITLPNETTITIGSTSKTYPVGTYYGQIVQDQITADGYHMTVFQEVNGEMSSDGWDGWYNTEKAVEYLNAAVAELKEADVKVNKRNPIQVDIPVFTGNETYNKRGEALKQNLEEALNGFVKINVIPCEKQTDWLFSGYYATHIGYAQNYDMYDLSGWGPDYGDPATYLDTYLPNYAGYMVTCHGLY